MSDQSALEKTVMHNGVEYPLSPAEFVVWKGLAAGKTVTELAAQRSVTLKTISCQIARIQSKLGVSTSMQLRAVAAKWAALRGDKVRYAVRVQLQGRDTIILPDVKMAPLFRPGVGEVRLFHFVETSGADRALMTLIVEGHSRV